VKRAISRRLAAGALMLALSPAALAQFQVPGAPRPGTPSPERPRTALPAELTYSWAVGSDSEFVYRRDADLDKRLRDNTSFFAPTLFGFFNYRPVPWLSTRAEVTLEVPADVKPQSAVLLPSGELLQPTPRRTSLLIDQAYASVKFPERFLVQEVTVGRRNFEDPRLWLYDAALDGVITRFEVGYLQAEASITRENRFDGDLLNNVPKIRTSNYIVYVDYRGIEDHRLAAYWIKREERVEPRQEGRPVFMGLRAYGRPADIFNYWADVGFARGHDELGRPIRGQAFDVGYTFRYRGAPLNPSVTAALAAGSGDRLPDDGINKEYRQTGLQSNEGRFGGLTQFKRYGETLDPELSNINIVTVGVGFRPLPNAFVDVVHHYYRLRHIASEIRNWGLTAKMNEDPSVQSKSVGREIDVIVGFRNLFGVRRLGFEVRAGVFFPGEAFRNNVSADPNNPGPTFMDADKSVSVLAVIIL
jgi:alginate production protein